MAVRLTPGCGVKSEMDESATGLTGLRGLAAVSSAGLEGSIRLSSVIPGGRAMSSSSLSHTIQSASRVAMLEEKLADGRWSRDTNQDEARQSQRVSHASHLRRVNASGHMMA